MDEGGDLIGPNGGRTLEAQYTTIEKIASYLNVRLSSAEVEAIAEYSYVKKEPNNHTYISDCKDENYKRSQIDSWKTYLSEPNKVIFKELYNDLLVDLGYETDENC